MQPANTAASRGDRLESARDRPIVTPTPDLSAVSLSALGRCDDDEFEKAAAGVLQQIERQESSVAGHTS